MHSPSPTHGNPPTSTASSQTTPNRQRGVRKILPGSNLAAAGIVVTDVGPTKSDWLPRVLEQLRPVSVQTVRDRVNDFRTDLRRPDRPTITVDRYLQEDILNLQIDRWRNTTRLWSDTDAEVAQYAGALAEYAARFHDTDADDLEDSTYKQNWHNRLVDTLTSIGTGRGDLNAGLDALAKGPARLHCELDERPRVLTLALDGEAWSNLTDRRTGQRALATIAVLGIGFDVRLLMSPAVEQELERRYPRWYDAHLCLTESRHTSTHNASHSDERNRDELLQEAWVTLKDEVTEATGKLRLLANLCADSYRGYHDLSQDSEIDAAEGTIGRYVRELEDADLVTIDRSGLFNSVALTRLGTVAVEEFVTEDYTMVHPDQSTLETHLTSTLQRETSTVYGAHTSTGGGRETDLTAEDWLATTGDPSADADYVQWLDGPTEFLDAWGMHRRYLAGRRDRGITLIDDRITDWRTAEHGDGRVAYLSCFDDDCLTILQWGGVLPTLGRLAGVLLSDKAFNKILTPSRLGTTFENIDNGVAERLNEAIDNIVRLGHQIGWFSEDERDYDGWRERYQAVRSLCLKKVGTLTNSSDVDARTELIKDLHGLIASATQVYYAAGIDVTINLRIPDMQTLVTDERRLTDFLDFLRYTVPKQSVYGIHSGPRMLLEKREEKLKRRLPYVVDSQDSTMHLTASWILSGPTMTDLRDEIQEVIQAEAAEVREQIQDGQEVVPVLEIPVMIGNSYTALRATVKDFAAAKNFRVAQAGEFSPEGTHDLERLVRLFLRILGTADRPHRGCPHDVAEAMLYIARSTKTADYLAVRDIEYGLAQLPATRLFPELPPSATKMVKAVFTSDEPMGRSEIINAAEISESSYTRYLEELAAWDVFEPRYVDGHRRWEAYLEPWWSPQTNQDDPYAQPNPETGILFADFPRDVAQAAMCHLSTYYDQPALEEAYLEGIQPEDDIEAIFKQHPRLRRWWPFLWGAFADEVVLKHGPPSGQGVQDIGVATIGIQFTGKSSGQGTLPGTSVPLESSSGATEGL